MRRRVGITAIVTFVIMLAGVTASAQTATPTPAPSPAAGGSVDLSESLQNMTQAAANFVPAFVREVEKPLGGYFMLLAWWLAWLVFMIAFLKVLRQREGADGDTYWFFGRVAVCFALLWYLGDVNGDGIKGDLINEIGSVGNTIAYGQLNDEGATGYLQSVVTRQQKTFNRNYTDFLNNAFTVQVKNEEMPVRYPDDGTPYQRLSALYSGGDDLAAVNEAFNPSGWDMGNLFQWLNFSRGLVEFGDLFLLVLQGFLVAALRLAAPFAVAVAIDREWAKKISHNMAWAVVVVCLILPIISQVIRFFAYLAANMAMDAQSSQPYYRWDPTTLQIVAQGNPIYMIMIAAMVMTIAALCMFGSPYISYRLASGQVFEGVSSMVTSWFGAGTGTALSAYSASAGAAVSKQAEQTQIHGTTQAEGINARSTLAAGNTEARHRASAESVRSRSSAQESASNAQVSAWAQNERAVASQTKMERNEAASVNEQGIVQGGKVAGAQVTAQLGIDQAPYKGASEVPILGSIIGGGAKTIADLSKMSGVSDGGGVRTVTSPNPPPFQGVVTDTWGTPRSYGGHTGTDLGWRQGEGVGSAAPGVIAFAGDTGDGYGNRVVVNHGNGWATSYSHLSSLEGMQAGQIVGQGQTIGRVGATGGNYRPHLHYEVGKINAQGTEIAAGSKINPELTNLRPVRGGGGAPPPQLTWEHGLQSEPYPRREALTPLVVAQMDRDAVMAGANYRATENIRAGREETNSVMAINSTEASAHSHNAWTADAQRQGAIQTELRGSMEGNQIRYGGSMDAIKVRHEASMAAAKLHAVGSVMQAVGSTAASQMQSVFQQFNRF